MEQSNITTTSVSATNPEISNSNDDDLVYDTIEEPPEPQAVCTTICTVITK